MQRGKLPAAIISAFVATIGGFVATTGIPHSVLAQDDMRSRDDRRSFDGPRVGIEQAVRAAERETGGRAVEADYEYDRGTAIYEVEVLRDGQTYDVHVDAESGDVIRTVSARDDDDRRGRDGDDDD